MKLRKTALAAAVVLFVFAAAHARRRLAAIPRAGPRQRLARDGIVETFPAGGLKPAWRVRWRTRIRQPRRRR